jgi:hypothetical protein
MVHTHPNLYEGLFLGSVAFSHYKRIWKSLVLPKCHFFIWLVAQKKCWTTDRLAKRGLNHSEKCLLYDQEEETLNHLLVKCSFSREFWYLLLRKFGLHSLAPQSGCRLLGQVGRGRGSNLSSYQKGPLPSSYWELGLYGIIGINVSLMAAVQV